MTNHCLDYHDFSQDYLPLNNCRVLKISSFSSVQFSSGQDDTCAHGKAHMRQTLSLQSFPRAAFETVPMFVWLTTALSRPFKEVEHFPFLRLSRTGDRWCDVPCFVPAVGISSSSTLQSFQNASHLCRVRTTMDRRNNRVLGLSVSVTVYSSASKRNYIPQEGLSLEPTTTIITSIINTITMTKIRTV